jgi:hypothetical protein
MAAKDVGLKDFCGDPLLAGVDHFDLGHSGGDLLAVARLNGIAEHNSHGQVASHGRRIPQPKAIVADLGFHDQGQAKPRAEGRG